MLSLKDKSECCGCTACFSVCPKKCIIMKPDNEGFLYPVIDINKCVDCGLCEKVCPMQNIKTNENKPDVYAAINRNEEIRMQSSSGGIFTLLAEYTINKGGVVFGACFDGDWNVVHDYTETKEGLVRFRCSKYVQSKLEKTFVKVKSFLDAGREVLFSGTPCQVAGLKNYLLKPYSNLITIDVVCHGVPSPGVWRKYLQETIGKFYHLDKKVDFKIGEYISHINFRSKENGWKKYNLRIDYKDGRIKTLPFCYSPYMNTFLSNLSLRPSCYACRTRSNNIQSDITLADFWGIEQIRPELDDDKGYGLVLINNNRKIELLQGLDCNMSKQSYDTVVKYNQNILSSVKIPVNRDFFFFIYRKKGFYMAYNAITSKSVLMRIIRKIYRSL